MGLADAFAQGPPIVKGPACSVAVLLEQLSDDDKAALLAAFNDKRWRSSAISSQLESEGIDLHASTIARHRRGACKCRHMGAP